MLAVDGLLLGELIKSSALSSEQRRRIVAAIRRRAEEWPLRSG